MYFQWISQIFRMKMLLYFIEVAPCIQQSVEFRLDLEEFVGYRPLEINGELWTYTLTNKK